MARSMNFEEVVDNLLLLDETLMQNNGNMVYIRKIDSNVKISYCVFSENGEKLANFTNFDAAWYSAVKLDLQPMTLH